jgi:hypothetical protein
MQTDQSIALDKSMSVSLSDTVKFRRILTLKFIDVYVVLLRYKQL